MVLGDIIPYVSDPKIISYDFRSSHVNLIKNEHVKLNETRLDTQGCLKENLSNVMDVLGRLTSQLHEA